VKYLYDCSMALVLTDRIEKDVEWNKLCLRNYTWDMKSKSLCSPEVPRRIFFGPGECRVFPEKSKF
jgi:hypothetical protein